MQKLLVSGRRQDKEWMKSGENSVYPEIPQGPDAMTYSASSGMNKMVAW